MGGTVMDEKLPPPSPQEQEQRLEAEHVSRRSFLMNVGIALNALVGAVVAAPIVAYVLGPVLRRREYLAWVSVGSVSDFPPGETKLVNFRNPFSNSWDGQTSKIPAYVRCAEAGKFTVFAINCAHLGCPVRWFSESQLFMCPCHGGVYYADGSVSAGPPPRPLPQYPVRVREGQVEILTSPIPIV
jgi:Rieske Fe-S protein